MSHLGIMVTTLAADRIDGTCWVLPENAEAPWSITVDWTELASTLNSAIKAAAIAAAEEISGVTVGALDKKTLFGGAVGL